MKSIGEQVIEGPFWWKLRFVEARYFRVGRTSDVKQVVLHSMEIDKVRNAAENVGKWWHGLSSPPTSCHFCVDNDSYICCVHPDDTAYHCGVANAWTVGIEMAGRASQTREEWLDEYSTAMLDKTALLTAECCRYFGLPVRYVGVGEVIDGMRGITTHNDITKAFKKGSHTDPGPGFPMDIFIGKVLTHYERLVAE